MFSLFEDSMNVDMIMAIWIAKSHDNYGADTPCHALPPIHGNQPKH
jgi:hypothetical protein